MSILHKVFNVILLFALQTLNRGKNLTGVMPVEGRFACQKHTHNKNARQVTYKV